MIWRHRCRVLLDTASWLRILKGNLHPRPAQRLPRVLQTNLLFRESPAMKSPKHSSVFLPTWLLIVACLAQVPALCATTAESLPQQPEATIAIHGFESLDGISKSWGGDCTEIRLDLNTERSFVSEGRGSLHLSGQSGKTDGKNYYNGVTLSLASIDIHRRAVLLDCWTSTPASTHAVYVRLFGPGRKQVAGWVNWGKPFTRNGHLTIRLDDAVSGDGFTWEEASVQTESTMPVVAAEIIIGTNTPDTTFDIYIDDLRITQSRHIRFDEVTEPKKLCLETTLVRARQPEAVLISPADDRYTELARRLQQKIRELTGAELAILPADQATREQLAATNAILLGNVCDNRAILPLYSLMYTPVDHAYPPEDGYLAHTVHDPWGTGKNALVLGGSSVAGTAKAVAAFLTTLQPGDDLILPKTNLFALDAEEMRSIERRQKTLDDDDIARQVERAKNDFARGAHRSVAGRMGNLGFEYCRSGNDMLARLYKELAVAWRESYQAKPDIYGGPWGMDMDFHLKEVLPAWDLLEESPALTDDERLEVTQILFEFITTDVVRKAAGALRSNHVRHNHTTFPALGLYFAGEYFRKGYACIESRHWLNIAQACFSLQAEAAKPHEDCNGYGWLVPYHTMRYALASGDTKCFDNGTVRSQADYAILTMDNLGYQVPYGDTGSWRCWFSEVPYLRGAAMFYRDGRYAWVLDKKQAIRPDQTKYQYACRIEPKEPADLLGARAIPLDRMYWESFSGPDTIPLDKAVDKVVMRASFDPGRQYLLLDGLSNGGHKHYDGNSISRITDRNRIWLADNDYIRSLPKFHNSMLVFRDGQAETIPAYCELEAVADTPAKGISQTVVRNYAGVDWHRAILWSKERFFLVIDDLVALEPADYDFHCFWHVVGQTELTPQGLEVEQKGPKFFIRNGSGVRTSLTDDSQLGKNWAGYEFAEPVVHSMRQVQSARLETAERLSFANLLFASDAETPQDFVPAMLNGQTVLVRSEDELSLGGVGDPQTPRQLVPGLKLAARAFLLAEPSGLAVDAQSFAWRETTLSANHPIQLEITEGQLHLTADAPTIVTFTGLEGKPTFSGSVSNTSKKDDRWTIHLAPGQAAITSTGLGLSGLNDVLKAIDIPASEPGSKLAGPQTPSATTLWSVRPDEGTPAETFTALAVGDLDGNGCDEIIAGTDANCVRCLGADGKKLWKFAAKGLVTTTAIADLDQSNQKYALAGSEDHNVYALTATGALHWSFELPQYKRPGNVRVLYAADLNGDGHEEVIAGGDNWRYYALDASGQKLWRHESVHPSSAGASGDLDGDGKLETLCGTVYYWWPCVDCKGTQLWRYSVRGPHATVALTANLQGNGQRAAVFGSEDGNLHVLDSQGKRLWLFNVGDEVTGALALDVDADNRDEIVASSLSFNVFALDASGTPSWRTNLGSPVRSLTAADVNGDGRKELIAGCDDGRILVLDGQGACVGHFQAASRAQQLVAAQLEPGKRQQIVARLLDGTLVAFQWE